MPSGTGNVHVDQAMTNVSLMYSNADFVADEVYAPIPVQKRSDKYFTYGQENFRGDDDARAPGAEADESQWSLSTDTYYADGHARAMVIPDEYLENEDEALDLSTDTTEILTEQIFLRREINLVTKVTADCTTVNNSTGAQNWDIDTVDPVKAIDAQKIVIRKASGKAPNRLLLSEPVFFGIRNNLLVKNRISGAQSLDASLITTQMLATVLGVEKVIVAAAVKATTKEGQTQANDYVWGKNALLYYKPPSPGKRTVALGYQMTWKTGRLGSLVYRFRLETRHADKIEVMKYYDLKTVAAGAGILFSNAIQ